MLYRIRQAKQAYQEQPEYDSRTLETLLALYTIGYGIWQWVLGSADRLVSTLFLRHVTEITSVGSVITGVATLVGVLVGRWVPAGIAMLGAVWWAILMVAVRDVDGYGAGSYNCFVLCALNLSIIGKGRYRNG